MGKTACFLVILILALAACSQDPGQEATDGTGQGRHTWKLICVGDGFTAGVGVQPDEAYPAQLSVLLSEAGNPVKVVNAAIKGESVVDFGDRLDWLLQQRFDAMLLVYGMERTGDASGGGARLEDWARILQRIHTVQPRATMWIGTDQPQHWENLLKAWPGGRGMRIRVVDLSLPPVNLKPRMWGEGGDYPSRQGHEALARRLVGVYSSFLSTD